ncbi:MAG: hypothetical protein IT460_05570 [Planctomycetes bacterium]|nr:hypothetical protein [Planctomycetota bacterium]
MKRLLATLVLSVGAVAGFAPKADASPLNLPAHAHGRGSVSVGFGFGGGGYYAPAPVQSGYWTTEYRWVPTTVCVGYDVYRRPIYQTQYVQQAYQVWVPTRVYAPTYYRPPVTFGVGFGYRWR